MKVLGTLPGNWKHKFRQNVRIYQTTGRQLRLHLFLNCFNHKVPKHTPLGLNIHVFCDITMIMPNIAQPQKHPFPCWIHMHDKILFLPRRWKQNDTTKSLHQINQHSVTHQWSFSGMSSRVIWVSQAHKVLKVEIHFTEFFQTLFERHFEVCEIRKVLFRRISRLQSCGMWHPVNLVVGHTPGPGRSSLPQIFGTYPTAPHRRWGQPYDFPF